jgi:hypothetical protein
MICNKRTAYLCHICTKSIFRNYTVNLCSSWKQIVLLLIWKPWTWIDKQQITIVISVQNYYYYYNPVALVRERTIPSDRSPLVSEVSANFTDRGCRVVGTIVPNGRILAFLDWSRFFFHVAPQLYSRDGVVPVPDSLILRKSGSAGNRTRNSGSVARNSGH